MIKRRELLQGGLLTSSMSASAFWDEESGHGKSLGSIIVHPEDFGATGGDIFADTKAWQGAIDHLSKRGGGSVVAQSRFYALSGLTVGVSNIRLDFAGSEVQADLRSGSRSLVNASGSQGQTFSFENAVRGQCRLRLLDQAAAKMFAPGDIVRVSDGGVLAPWDVDREVAVGASVVGRSQMNWVERVLDNEIILAVPLGWAFDVSPLVRRINAIMGFEVSRIACLREVDPGIPFAGDTQFGPHLFSCHWCDAPHVHDINVVGFQLHVADFRQCVRPTAERIRAENAFRPRSGGHGYTIRFDGCVGAFAFSNFGKGVRHHIDDSASFDTTSCANMAVNAVVSAYKTHGTGSHGYTSHNDTHLGGDGATGWEIGNESYAADYNATIVSPRQRGGRYGIKCLSRSEMIRISDVKFEAISENDIVVWGGAKNVTISGGAIVIYPAAKRGAAILVGDRLHEGQNKGVACENIDISGIKFYVLRGEQVGSIIKIDAKGFISVKENGLRTEASCKSFIEIGGQNKIENLQISQNAMEGEGGESMVVVRTLPTGIYIVDRNCDVGGSRDFQITAGSNLRMRENAIQGGSKFFGDIDAALQRGAIIAGNDFESFNER